MFTLDELPMPDLSAAASKSTAFELKPLRSSAFPSVLHHVKSSVNFQPAPSPKPFPRQRTLSDSASHSSPRLRRQRTLKGGFPATAAELETISPANEETRSIGARSHSETDLSCRSEFLSAAQRAAEQAEEFVLRVWKRGWELISHHNLPNWMKDNEYLKAGYRPELRSAAACFKSIFRVHTETGNIWTHLLGTAAFIGMLLYICTRSSVEVALQEKTLISTFFLSAITCLGFSTIFHILSCHSEKCASLFAKLDYCGIAILIVGSKIPYIYYTFYCEFIPKLVYMSFTLTFGTACLVVSLWDKFATPTYRPLRAGIFIVFGLGGVIPSMHVLIKYGLWSALNDFSLGWLALMGALYIGGALIYAFRIPERIFPGKFDIWLQSHQIFHVCVVTAAFVHYYGLVRLLSYRMAYSDCLSPDDLKPFADSPPVASEL